MVNAGGRSLYDTVFLSIKLGTLFVLIIITVDNVDESSTFVFWALYRPT